MAPCLTRAQTTPYSPFLTRAGLYHQPALREEDDLGRGALLTQGSVSVQRNKNEDEIN